MPYQPTKKWDLKVFCFWHDGGPDTSSYKKNQNLQKAQFLLYCLYHSKQRTFQRKKQNLSDSRASEKTELNRREMKSQYQPCNPETKLLGQWQDGGGRGREGWAQDSWCSKYGLKVVAGSQQPQAPGRRE